MLGAEANLSELSAVDSKYEYDYLIKYKNSSYLHVQWLSAADIDLMNKRSRQALDRYLVKLDRGDPNVSEDAEVDPRYFLWLMCYLIIRTIFLLFRAIVCVFLGVS